MEYLLIKWKMSEDSGKTKSYQTLIQETGITEAEASFKETMKDTVADYEIISISQSKISEVLLNTNN